MKKPFEGRACRSATAAQLQPKPGASGGRRPAIAAWRIGRLLSLLNFAFLILNSAFAGYLQPTVAYITDSQGNPMVGSNVVITAWPPANAITGVGTNLIANVTLSETTGAGGFISNSLAVGNYRLQIAGYPHGVMFGVYSNAAAINISQVGSEPVPVYQNFSIKQFSDAGTMAGRSTNDFIPASYTAVSNAVAFNLATNGGPLNYAQLPWTPPTNTPASILFDLQYTPPTNTTAGIDWALGYVPLTNTYAAVSNAVGFVIATNGGPVAYSQLPYTPPTNTYAGISNVLHFVLATNGAAIAATQLQTNVLVSFWAAPWAVVTTNLGVCQFIFYTNAGPFTAFTNYPPGSFGPNTNGAFFVLSNATWLMK